MPLNGQTYRNTIELVEDAIKQAGGIVDNYWILKVTKQDLCRVCDYIEVLETYKCDSPIFSLLGKLFK